MAPSIFQSVRNSMQSFLPLLQECPLNANVLGLVKWWRLETTSNNNYLPGSGMGWCHMVPGYSKGIQSLDDAFPGTSFLICPKLAAFGPHKFFLNLAISRSSFNIAVFVSPDIPWALQSYLLHFLSLQYKFRSSSDIILFQLPNNNHCPCWKRQ